MTADIACTVENATETHLFAEIDGILCQSRNEEEVSGVLHRISRGI